ncbi:unnamed protein product [Ilex paraguariensis]|uniref:S-protein homolog n=1 Tax=Ilex paraguariensis TaxID=185542 RepID=A0ABC8T596_9AQUA
MATVTNPLFLGTIFFCFSLGSALHEHILWANYHIRIINNINDGSTPLVVHCKSRDKDLDERSLYKGETYFFEAQIDLFRKAVVICFMTEGNRSMYIEAFKATRDENRRQSKKVCLWSVRDDGTYFRMEEEIPTSYTSMEMNGNTCEKEVDNTINVKERLEEPKMGMVFNTVVDEIMEYYIRYSNGLGFPIKKKNIVKGR